MSAAATKYLSLAVKSEAGAKPFVQCTVRVAPGNIQGIDLRKPLRLRKALRDAVSEHAPKYRYVDADIRSIETARGTQLPLAVLDNPIACLGRSFGDGLVVTIASSEADAASPKAAATAGCASHLFANAASCVTPSPTRSAGCYFYDTVLIGAESVSESVVSLFTCSSPSKKKTSSGDGGKRT